MNDEYDILNDVTFMYTSLKLSKALSHYFLYTSLESHLLKGFPHFVTVIGKKYTIKFEFDHNLSDNKKRVYLPTNEYKLDIPSCREYVVILYKTDKDIEL